MKRAKSWITFGVVLLIVLSACMPPTPLSEDTPTPDMVATEEAVNVTSCDVLRASGSLGWYPYFIEDEATGEITGASIDLLEAMAPELGVEGVEVVSDLPWNRLFIRLEKGTLDVISAVYWTEEREELYHYTNPYMEDEIRIFVLKGNEFEFDEWSDLKGKRGGRPLGGSYGEEFDRYAEENLIQDEAKGAEANFKKLLLGRIDYLIYAYWDGRAYMQRAEIEDEVVILPNPVITNDVHFLLSPTSPCGELVEPINELIEQYKADGTIDAIIETYR